MKWRFFYRHAVLTRSAVVLVIVMLPLTLVAVAAEKILVKINHVTLSLLVDKKSGRSGDLSSISFSIENLATKPLERVTFRVIARSHDGSLLQTDSFEEDMSKIPLGAKEAKRLTHFMSIDGFLIDGKRGSIDVTVLNYTFWSEDGWRLLIPPFIQPYPDMALESADYFESIKRSIELVWQYPELALRYGVQGTLLVQFTIYNKNVLSQRIVRSSGSQILDNEALRAVRAAVLPPLPSFLRMSAWMEYHHDGRRLDMQFAKDVDRSDVDRSYEIKKPLSEWRHVKSFNNRMACEKYKEEAAGIAKPWNMKAHSDIDAVGYSSSRCVPSDFIEIK